MVRNYVPTVKPQASCHSKQVMYSSLDIARGNTLRGAQ